MRVRAFVLAAVTSLVVGAAAADARAFQCDANLPCDDPLRWADRHEVADARFAIHTDNRKVTLVLTDRVVAMQLSDKVMRRIDRKLDAREDDEDNTALGRAIKTAVLSGVRSLLDHSAECDIRDIKSADYRNGELILTAKNGKHLYANAEVDDDNVMTRFEPADARAFVHELRQRIARQR
jgi:hypothetical protein